MEVRTEVKDNWLTQKIPSRVFYLTLFLVSLLLVGSFLFLHQYFGAHLWMPASFENVFIKHEYWRLWTTLFAHGDLVHVFSNLILFFSFAYYLSGYFSILFFPLFGFLLGGLTNLIVLSTMPSHIMLIGVSGVVYWMGAAWMILFYFIDRRESKGKRLLRIIGISLILFFPQTYQQNVSYLSHGIGFILGLISGYLLYIIKEKTFHSKEVLQYTFYDPDQVDWRQEEGI